MAYSELQKTDIAHELARSGGNVEQAVAALRAQYDSFARIGSSTLHRLMREPGFAARVAARAEVIARAREQAAAEAERLRARREAEDHILARLARDEALLDGARDQLERALQSAALAPDAAIRAFDSLARIIDRRRAQVLPAIAETREAAWLVESVMEAAVAVLGSARAKGLIAKVRELYTARSAAGLPDPAGPATPAAPASPADPAGPEEASRGDA